MAAPIETKDKDEAITHLGPSTELPSKESKETVNEIFTGKEKFGEEQPSVASMAQEDGTEATKSGSVSRIVDLTETPEKLDPVDESAQKKTVEANIEEEKFITSVVDDKNEGTGKQGM